MEINNENQMKSIRKINNENQIMTTLALKHAFWARAPGRILPAPQRPRCRRPAPEPRKMQCFHGKLHSYLHVSAQMPPTHPKTLQKYNGSCQRGHPEATQAPGRHWRSPTRYRILRGAVATSRWPRDGLEMASLGAK